MYQELMIYIKSINDVLFKGVQSFYTWEGLQELRGDSLIVSKINKKLNSFYGTVSESTKISYIIQLGILFDKDKQAISLHNLIDFIQKNKESFTKEEFQKHNIGRDKLEELIKDYKGVTDEDINKATELLKGIDDIRLKVWRYRSEYIAHKDKDPKELNISPEEIIRLYKTIENIINIFSSSSNHNITLYSHIESVCKREIKYIFSKI